MMMDFKQEAFPLYGELLKSGVHGVEVAIKDFEAAVNGGHEERFKFALGIQQVAALQNVDLAFPDLTPAMKLKTLSSCLVVFNEAAAAGHAKAAIMVEEFAKRGVRLSS